VTLEELIEELSALPESARAAQVYVDYEEIVGVLYEGGEVIIKCDEDEDEEDDDD
jgi:hypothetical protein